MSLVVDSNKPWNETSKHLLLTQSRSAAFLSLIDVFALSPLADGDKKQKQKTGGGEQEEEQKASVGDSERLEQQQRHGGETTNQTPHQTHTIGELFSALLLVCSSSSNNTAYRFPGSSWFASSSSSSSSLLFENTQDQDDQKDNKNNANETSPCPILRIKSSRQLAQDITEHDDVADSDGSSSSSSANNPLWQQCNVLCSSSTQTTSSSTNNTSSCSAPSSSSSSSKNNCHSTHYTSTSVIAAKHTVASLALADIFLLQNPLELAAEASRLIATSTCLAACIACEVDDLLEQLNTSSSSSSSSSSPSSPSASSSFSILIGPLLSCLTDFLRLSHWCQGHLAASHQVLLSLAEEIAQRTKVHDESVVKQNASSSSASGGRSQNKESESAKRNDEALRVASEKRRFHESVVSGLMPVVSAQQLLLMCAVSRLHFFDGEEGENPVTCSCCPSSRSTSGLVSKQMLCEFLSSTAAEWRFDPKFNSNNNNSKDVVVGDQTHRDVIVRCENFVLLLLGGGGTRSTKKDSEAQAPAHAQVLQAAAASCCPFALAASLWTVDCQGEQQQQQDKDTAVGLDPVFLGLRESTCAFVRFLRRRLLTATSTSTSSSSIVWPPAQVATTTAISVSAREESSASLRPVVDRIESTQSITNQKRRGSITSFSTVAPFASSLASSAQLLLPSKNATSTLGIELMLIDGSSPLTTAATTSTTSSPGSTPAPTPSKAAHRKSLSSSLSPANATNADDFVAEDAVRAHTSSSSSSAGVVTAAAAATNKATDIVVELLRQQLFEQQQQQQHQFGSAPTTSPSKMTAKVSDQICSAISSVIISSSSSGQTDDDNKVAAQQEVKSSTDSGNKNNKNNKSNKDKKANVNSNVSDSASSATKLPTAPPPTPPPLRQPCERIHSCLVSVAAVPSPSSAADSPPPTTLTDEMLFRQAFAALVEKSKDVAYCLLNMFHLCAVQEEVYFDQHVASSESNTSSTAAIPRGASGAAQEDALVITPSPRDRDLKSPNSRVVAATNTQPEKSTGGRGRGLASSAVASLASGAGGSGGGGGGDLSPGMRHRRFAISALIDDADISESSCHIVARCCGCLPPPPSSSSSSASSLLPDSISSNRSAIMMAVIMRSAELDAYIASVCSKILRQQQQQSPDPKNDSFETPKRGGFSSDHNNTAAAAAAKTYSTRSLRIVAALLTTIVRKCNNAASSSSAAAAAAAASSTTNSSTALCASPPCISAESIAQLQHIATLPQLSKGAEWLQLFSAVRQTSKK